MPVKFRIDTDGRTYYTKDDQEHPSYLCKVRQTVDYTSKAKKKPKVWRIDETEPHDYINYIQYVKFQKAEHAASFVYALVTRSNTIAEQRPLPENIARYLTERTEHLRTEERRLQSEFFQISRERCGLKQFAEKNGLTEVLWRTEDADPNKAVRELLEWRYDDLPFFSESSLYELLGKDSARTLRALLGNALKFVDPGLTEQLL